MTEQPDLPPELLERVAERVFHAAGGSSWGKAEKNYYRKIARAVAPMLIAHGRELENAEVVAWLRSMVRKDDRPFGLVEEYAARWALSHSAGAIQHKEHRIKQP